MKSFLRSIWSRRKVWLPPLLWGILLIGLLLIFGSDKSGMFRYRLF